MFLRQKGFNAGVEEEAVSLRALQYIDFSSNEIFLLTLKSILCRSKSQLDEFDDLFHEYWKELETAVNAKKKDNANVRKPSPQEVCLLYTSDAADEEDSVDLGGRRII